MTLLFVHFPPVKKYMSNTRVDRPLLTFDLLPLKYVIGGVHYFGQFFHSIHQLHQDFFETSLLPSKEHLLIYGQKMMENVSLNVLRSEERRVGKECRYRG